MFFSYQKKKEKSFQNTRFLVKINIFIIFEEKNAILVFGKESFILKPFTVSTNCQMFNSFLWILCLSAPQIQHYSSRVVWDQPQLPPPTGSAEPGFAESHNVIPTTKFVKVPCRHKLYDQWKLCLNSGGSNSRNSCKLYHQNGHH